ncbi:unnamed protein product [Owenia fusiformis]|uniref:Uncharacterized protein n=1 Tax=Owenia fusiformis TaxID=6347 RepID=A0A8J1TKI0_OWEFU|nr:unnamed protein product [Owenia fusiformis]
MEDRLICKESYGSQNIHQDYVRKSNGHIYKIDRSRRSTSLSQFFMAVFLPQGYPDTVSEDYLEYQLWDTMQAFASSITGTLATKAVLEGVGVGDENATALAATLTWLMKDGTGMVGRILFAWMQGTSLDYDAKRWRLFADILNDFAIFLEILAPLFKAYFTFIVCIAGVGKSIVGVAGGATRAALTQHQARRDNLADVSAKDGSQETLVNLSALLCSFALVPLVGDNQRLIWVLFLLFTAIHIFANYRAVTCVKMESINQARFHILIRGYLAGTGVDLIAKVNSQEPVFWKTRRKFDVFLGTQVQYISCKNNDDLETLYSVYKDQHYLLGVNLKKGYICIALHEGSKVVDHFKSCYQAEVINFAAQHSSTPQNNVYLNQIAEGYKNGDVEAMHQASLTFTNATFTQFMADIESVGWVTSRSLLGADEWRALWDINGISDKKDY